MSDSKLLKQLKIDRSYEPPKQTVWSDIWSCIKFFSPWMICILICITPFYLMIEQSKENSQNRKACLQRGYPDVERAGGEVFCVNRAQGAVVKLK